MKYDELRKLAEDAKAEDGKFITHRQNLRYAVTPSLVLALLDERERLRDALEDLMEDTQHSEHVCGDVDCPVAKAVDVLAETEPVEATR